MFTASTSNRASSKKMLRITEAIAMWFMSAGVCFSVFFLSDSWIPAIVSFVVLGVLTLAVRFTQDKPSVNRAILLASAVVLVLIAFLFAGPIQNEILIIVNKVIDGYNILTDSYFTHYATTDSTLVGAVAVGVEGAIITVFVASALMPLRTRIVTALIVAFAVIFNLLSMHPSMAVVSAVLIGWLGLWSLHSRNRILRATPTLTIMALAFVSLFIPMMVFLNYPGNVAISGINKQVAAAVDAARYGHDSLPQGNLYNAANMVAQNSSDTSVNPERMEVSFESPANVESLYLRGYTGATYNGSSWKPLTREDHAGEWEGLFRWLQESGFDQTYQAGEYQTLDDEQSGRAPQESTVALENVGAYRKYSYTSYGTRALEQSNSSTLLDRYLAGGGLSGDTQYNAVVALDLPETLTYTPSDWVTTTDGTQDNAQGSFVKTERVYKSFVEQKYMAVGNDQADFIEETFFGPTWDEAQDDNIFTLTTRIRSVLEASCSVTDSPAMLPANTDYVHWFLNDEKRGNSAAFASAAVLAYRQAGVPARYVEGYVLTQRNAQSMAASGETNVTLTGHDSHAWVELYLDGVGWMPVEVTPGFYQANYNTDQIIDIPKEVAGDGSDDAATGSVQGETGSNEAKDQTPLDVVGLSACVLLGLIIVLLVAILLAMAQRIVRLALYRSRIINAFNTAPADHTFTRWLYTRFQKILAQAGVHVNHNRPLDCLATIPTDAPDLNVNEISRALQQFQRCLFGDQALRAADIRFICDLCARLQQRNQDHATFFGRHRNLVVDVYGREYEFALDKMQGKSR